MIHMAFVIKCGNWEPGIFHWGSRSLSQVPGSILFKMQNTFPGLSKIVYLEVVSKLHSGFARLWNPLPSSCCIVIFQCNMTASLSLVEVFSLMLGPTPEVLKPLLRRVTLQEYEYCLFCSGHMHQRTVCFQARRLLCVNVQEICHYLIPFINIWFQLCPCVAF